MSKRASLFFLFLLLFQAPFCWADIFYVAPNGDDNNPGTFLQPWATLQKAADTAVAGSTVYARGGTYNEAVTIGVSGSVDGGYIVFQKYRDETPVIDGTGLTVPSDAAGLFLIEDRNYIVIEGFEIRNYITSTRDVVPAGIHVRGTSHHIELRNNRIHHIETHAPLSGGLLGADAHGIALYGTSATGSIHNIIIDGNELHDLVLGSSEALVLNGNVEDFEITHNVVRDCDNIAIDCIGFEGTCPNPVYDQARDGEISGNRVYNISSYGRRHLRGWRERYHCRTKHCDPIGYRARDSQRTRFRCNQRHYRAHQSDLFEQDSRHSHGWL